jgi:uroporphyrinogen decarboxylase
MSKKDDMVSALKCLKPAGAVPIWELEFHIWDAFSGKHVILGKELEKLSKAEREKALYCNAEIMLEVCEELCFAALTVPGPYWYIAPGEYAYYVLDDNSRLKQFDILRKLAPDDLMLIASVGGVLAMPESENYVEFSYKLFDAPDQIDTMAKQRLQSGIEDMKKFSDAGADAVFNAADIADNNGMFFNPEQTERFILPYLREWAAKAKEMGLYSILHTDGNIMACIEDLAESGINALQAIDPVAGMDMRKVKDIVEGRLCLCGNIDCGMLISGRPEEIYESTRDLLLSCKQGGGLVLGASNACQSEMPTENYLAMIKAWKDNGQY